MLCYDLSAVKLKNPNYPATLRYWSPFFLFDDIMNNFIKDAHNSFEFDVFFSL